uniref:Mediator of RNA polymerase II transcription subunit 21 n=1 Tax=Steinernema glaseri TaxID=37863 RepID=A0A1I7ZFK9_9BILA
MQAQQQDQQQDQPQDQPQDQQGDQPQDQQQPAPPQGRLNPPRYPRDILDNLEGQPISKLTEIGKELAQDLVNRVVLFNRIELGWDPKVEGTNEPGPMMEYWVQILRDIQNIQIVIDNDPRVNKKAKTNEDWIACLAGMGFPDKREELYQKEKRSEELRLKLLDVQADLKMLDWMAAVSDPSVEEGA